MIRCLKRPEHPTVRTEIKKWLDTDGEEDTAKLHKEWQKKAVEAVKIAFEFLKEDEKAMYKGNKSYFRCKEEGLDFPVGDDEEYMVLSETEG